MVRPWFSLMYPFPVVTLKNETPCAGALISKCYRVRPYINILSPLCVVLPSFISECEKISAKLQIFGKVWRNCGSLTFPRIEHVLT